MPPMPPIIHRVPFHAMQLPLVVQIPVAVPLVQVLPSLLYAMGVEAAKGLEPEPTATHRKPFHAIPRQELVSTKPPLYAQVIPSVE